MFHIGSLWVLRDGQPHLGLGGALAQLPAFIVEPILPLAHEQAGIINQVTVEVLLVVAVLQGRVGWPSVPGPLGESDTAIPIFESGLNPGPYGRDVPV